MTTIPTQHDSYDRLAQIKQFDESKLGVKGLLDSGVTIIPSFFHQPPENLPAVRKPKNTKPRITIPVIDLSKDRSTVVDEVRRAASNLGFFQIVNHGVGHVEMIDKLIDGMKSFFESSNEYKMKFYHREAGKGAAYSTNFDLYESKAASWRDTLQVKTSPVEPDWEVVPEMCKQAIKDWDKAVARLGEELMSILCEGLGVKGDRLKELTCLEARVFVNHYYPKCPQPELTVGLTSHTDPGVLAMLVQNEIGGLLQIKCGEDWVDVEPTLGAIVINIGDLLQMLSNDEYRSVEHRVLANPVEGARVSIAVLFNPSNRENNFGPFPELVSVEKPAVYKEFSYMDYMTRFFTKELDGNTLTNFYKIGNTNA